MQLTNVSVDYSLYIPNSAYSFLIILLAFKTFTLWGNGFQGKGEETNGHEVVQESWCLEGRSLEDFENGMLCKWLWLNVTLMIFCCFLPFFFPLSTIEGSFSLLKFCWNGQSKWLGNHKMPKENEGSEKEQKNKGETQMPLFTDESDAAAMSKEMADQCRSQIWNPNLSLSKY